MPPPIYWVVTITRNTKLAVRIFKDYLAEKNIPQPEKKTRTC